jgi:hypothetical protein
MEFLPMKIVKGLTSISALSKGPKSSTVTETVSPPAELSAYPFLTS